jgi:hypothetical protein
LGYSAYGHFAAQPSDLVFEALGEPSSCGQPRKRFLFHGTAMTAEDPAGLEFKIHSRAAAGQVPNAVNFTVIKTGLFPATAGAGTFF